MHSITYGNVDMDQIAKILCERVSKSPNEPHDILIGTDSQNFDKTKVVEVIAYHDVGHGGIFFYEITKVKLIRNISQKLYYETSLSLERAKSLMEALERYRDSTGFDFEKYMNFCIHVDAGLNGPSKNVIPEIVGWIRASGYSVAVKPDSVAACSIADKYSK